MALEIEAKMKLTEHAPVRAALESAGARLLNRYLETNSFFDTVDHLLQMRDRGLRVRRARDLDTGLVKALITHKGPRQPGAMKTRAETEVTVDSYEQAVELLEQLGFGLTLSFEKRRESWELGACEVELDELPHLGRFVEIEGPDEASIQSVRHQLGLEKLPLIQTGYATMVARRLATLTPPTRTLTFADTPST